LLNSQCESVLFLITLQNIHYCFQFFPLYYVRRRAASNALGKISNFARISIGLRQVDHTGLHLIFRCRLLPAAVSLIDRQYLTVEYDNGVFKPEKKTGAERCGGDKPDRLCADKRAAVYSYITLRLSCEALLTRDVFTL
jgi:hypothetical protein